MDILIAEDDFKISYVLAETIKGLKHHVETAGTGKDALKKVREKRFDLVLLDIFLPDCKGHELIPQFKEIWPDIGILAMTGYNSRELELEVRKQKVLYYMIKPFSIKEMKEVLDHISKKKGKGVKKEWQN